MIVRTSRRGMTLIEMLVSLMILSACMALVSGVTFQVAKVLSSMQSADPSRLPSFMLQHHAIDAALQRVAVGRLGRTATFTASPDRISFITTGSPRGDEHVEASIALVVKDDGVQGSALWLSDAQGELALLRTRSTLSFQFIDDQLAEHSRWPPNDIPRGAKVPRMIRVLERDRGVVALWVLYGPRFSHPSMQTGPGAFAGLPPP